MESKIKGKYQIIYNCGITQIKYLVSHDDYVNIFKASKERIFDIEIKNNFKETKESKRIKTELKIMFGDNFFTDKSPLYNAYLTGILELSKNQGGYRPCKIIKL